MGRGDDTELNLTEAELAADEAAVRNLLAPLGEPAAAPAPPGLASRVLAALPAAARPRARLSLGWAAAGLAALAMLLLGAWGVLGDSLGPARLAGGPAGGVGQLVLTLTLAAKPLVNLLADAGPAAALAPALIVAGAWLWLRLVRATPLAAHGEAR